MAVTEGSFKADFPEFADTATAIVNRCIGVAELLATESAFGDAHDDAVGYLTAHLVTRDPRGEPTAHAYGGGGVVGSSVAKGERVIRGTSRYRSAYESIRMTRIIPVFIA